MTERFVTRVVPYLAKFSVISVEAQPLKFIKKIVLPQVYSIFRISLHLLTNFINVSVDRVAIQLDL